MLLHKALLCAVSCIGDISAVFPEGCYDIALAFCLQGGCSWLKFYGVILVTAPVNQKIKPADLVGFRVNINLCQDAAPEAPLVLIIQLLIQFFPVPGYFLLDRLIGLDSHDLMCGLFIPKLLLQLFILFIVVIYSDPALLEEEIEPFHLGSDLAGIIFFRRVLMTLLDLINPIL